MIDLTHCSDGQLRGVVVDVVNADEGGGCVG